MRWSLFSITCILWSFFNMGCSAPHSLPPWIELIQRVPFQTLTVNNHRMAYLDAGEGHPVILIHGFGGSMWQWENQYSPLSRQFRVIIPDLIGSGISDKPDTVYSPEQLLHFFLEFMDILEIPQATLIGNSMGAGLAMAIALDHPHRVTNLILISGFPAQVADSVASPEFRRLLAHRPPLWLATIGNQIAGRGTTERFLKEMVYKPSLISAPVIERSFRNRQRGDLLRPLYSLLDHLDNWEAQYGKRLNHISQPTLLLWGGHDRVFPIDVGKALKSLIPQAEWHIIPEAGHLPQWEQPQIVNPLISQFLDKHKL